jgi:hypothetical protein
MTKEQFLAENLKLGEVYAGLIIGQEGKSDYHLFVVPDDAEGLTWHQAMKFALKAGASIPTRQELHLMFINIKKKLKDANYWSVDPHSHHGDFAWSVDFRYGDQIISHKANYFRVRLVRRVPLIA